VLRGLKIPPTPGLEVRSFCHGERRRKAREEVTVVLAIGQALRAHEALSRPDALSGFLEVVHRLFENGVFVGHEKSIRAGILRSLNRFASPVSTLGARNATTWHHVCSFWGPYRLWGGLR
jgi:hypothetical protein